MTGPMTDYYTIDTEACMSVSKLVTSPENLSRDLRVSDDMAHTGCTRDM